MNTVWLEVQRLTMTFSLEAFMKCRGQSLFLLLTAVLVSAAVVWSIGLKLVPEKVPEERARPYDFGSAQLDDETVVYWVRNLKQETLYIDYEVKRRPESPSQSRAGSDYEFELLHDTPYALTAGEAIAVGQYKPDGPRPRPLAVHVSYTFPEPYKEALDYVYGAPFENDQTVFISQGFNGESTHQGTSRYAVDMAVPEGTPILAVRSGTVVDAFDKNGWTCPRWIRPSDPDCYKHANSLTIRHEDGSVASYGHIQQHSLLVDESDQVAKGQPIAAVGSTGTRNPHLHLQISVFEGDAEHMSKSILFRMENGSEAIDEFTTGQELTVK